MPDMVSPSLRIEPAAQAAVVQLPGTHVRRAAADEIFHEMAGGADTRQGRIQQGTVPAVFLVDAGQQGAKLRLAFAEGLAEIAPRVGQDTLKMEVALVDPESSGDPPENPHPELFQDPDLEDAGFFPGVALVEAFQRGLHQNPFFA